MCGIVGFTGNHQAAPILLYGLSRLEYRGYDSAGLAVRDGEGDTEVIKAKGRLKVLADKTNNGESVPGTCGIGHTRWATHGEPSETNAHPHMSDDGNVVAVHNGIIENYQELKDKLIRNGYEFYSSTDTEVAVKLVDYYYKKYLGTPVDAINHAMVRIRGSYALAIMFKDYPGEIYVARKDSPMILGVENGESYIASDVPAILKYTRNVYYIGNLEMARIRKGEITFYNLDGDEIQKEPKTIEWDAEAAEKAGFEHFMIKEIHEQPKAVRDTLNSVLKDDRIDFSEVGLTDEEIKKISQIYIVACGSAYHVGMAAQYVIEDLTRIPVRVELASEFRYRNPILDPGEIYVARKDSPMILGVENGESYIASDVPAILKYTRNVYYIGNLEMARIRKGEITFYNLDGDEIQKEPKTIEWDAEAAEKAGFEHFMIKEIHEQPKAVRDTLNSVLKDDRIDFSEVGLTDEEIKKISQIYIVACGSAYHVGMAAQYVIEDLTRIPVRVELASEFRYRNPILDPEGLVVIVSQSGETADSLAALREAKQRGIRTLGIVNVVGSSIAREADNVFYTLAGPEISVATTKAYSTQLIASYALAVQFGKVREQITEEKYQELIAELKTLPDKIAKIIEDDKERIQWFAAKQANARDAFFIGRGIDYAISMEGSLKMKEVSYVHTEAYAAGELKHGTISLIEDGTLVIGILTQNHLYEKTVSNMVECKSRGAYLMGLTTYGHYNIEDTADFTVYIPKTDPHFATSLAVIPLQLLGYYVSVAKGLDVDKPRNLAKSVTVE